MIDCWFTVNAPSTATPPANCMPTDHNAVLYVETMRLSRLALFCGEGEMEPHSLAARLAAE